MLSLRVIRISAIVLHFSDLLFILKSHLPLGSSIIMLSSMKLHFRSRKLSGVMWEAKAMKPDS
ncbi:MAG: hypothetical protein DRM97_03340 [Thermoprotei archaeon]|nr:MAG: hypothetical protein DRM97_03340 [Thermoprotei archaeon]